MTEGQVFQICDKSYIVQKRTHIQCGLGITFNYICVEELLCSVDVL